MLEARFRAVAATPEPRKTVEAALREVERTGKFVDDEPDGTERASPPSVAVRPLLQTILQEPGAQVSFFVRGGTALVQGQKGATAERSARAVREIVASSKAVARRLGLGQATGVHVSGDFGIVAIAPGENGSGAVWSKGPVSRTTEDRLRELSTLTPDRTEIEA